MKAKRTMRDIKSQYPTIIQVSYCDAQNMLCIKNDWINPNGKNTEV